LPGYVRTTVTPLDDPSLRVLHTSEQGIVAGGDQLHVFPPGRAFEPHGVWEAAAFDGSWVRTAAPDRLACFFVGDGKLRWDVEARPDGPVLGRLDRGWLASASGNDAPDTLTGFQFPQGGVSFVCGGRAIARLRPNAGEGRVYPAPRTGMAGFHPSFTLEGWYDLAQTADGRMLVWEPGDQPAREFPCTRKPWPEPPVPVERGRFLLPDDGGVFLFDAKAGKELARYTIPGGDSLTGELPRLRVHRGNVLLVVDRNHGVELDRLRLPGLERAWDRSPILVGRELEDLAFGGDRFFAAADGTLTAFDWKDGRPLWEVPLPDAPHSHWRLSVSPHGLLVHPAEAVLLKPDFDAIGEFRRAGWSRDGLLRAVDRSYDAWTARELPVLVLDPADGRLVQRLTFPAAGPAAGVAVTPKGAVVVTGKGSWILASLSR
jgi:outer membrane protein assembly factor BamB